jgi:hypothetical protein
MELGGSHTVRVPVAANPHPTIEELLDMSFSVCSVLYQRKIVNDFFLGLLDRIKKVG